MLRRPLSNPHHTLYYTPHFPYATARCVEGYRVVLGIGGNIGDVMRRFDHLFYYLQRSRWVTILKSSPILKNPPFGYTKQADFLNAVIEIATPLRPEALLRYLLRVEKRFGRRRSFPDAPRTLDIDMIFYEGVTQEREVLTLPHAGWQERDSVLIPLLYLQQRGQR